MVLQVSSLKATQEFNLATLETRSTCKLMDPRAAKDSKQGSFTQLARMVRGDLVESCLNPTVHLLSKEAK